MTATAPRSALRAGPRPGVPRLVVTIMVKELRSRMRGRRAFIVLTIYLGSWR